MRFNNLIFAVIASTMISGCGGSGSTGTSSSQVPGTTPTNPATKTNILTITVADPSYPNKPTVSVKVCAPGSTTNCQTINNVLLDTGSYGLRVFKQALNGVSLTQVNVGSKPLSECMAFIDNSGDWGPVQLADVVMGGETASNVPIQVIDSTYFSNALPAACKSPNVTGLDQNPTAAGFNGILGVGLFASDCGTGCAQSANNGYYFTCNSASCTGSAVQVANQVTNPVALLNQDNNGVIVQLPSIGLGGVSSTSGQLILGIGTQTNNKPSGVTTYPASSSGEFTTIFNGITSQNSFIDSGSNGLFFSVPASILAPCTGLNQGWYCPSTEALLSAANRGYGSTASITTTFNIGNSTSLFNTNRSAFPDLGGTSPSGSGFDWGLPFFFGKSVFVGFDNTPSNLGVGPYWAF